MNPKSARGKTWDFLPAEFSEAPSIMWFRDDLRIAQNEALDAAARQGPVVAVYIAEDAHSVGVRPLGGAAKWWLHHSLDRLCESLVEHDVPLVILSGDPRTLIPELAVRIGARQVSWSRRYHRPHREVDAAVQEALEADGVAAHSFPGQLLAEPWTIATGAGTPYKVFTPFSRRLRRAVEDQLEEASASLDREAVALHGPGATPELSSADLADLVLLPSHSSRRESDWAGGLGSAWRPGEQGAWERLESFQDLVAAGGGEPGYAEGRDFPGRSVTSRLSPHLRFGEINPRTVWEEMSQTGAPDRDVSAFQSELMWRDFAWHRLYDRPDLATVNVRREFDAFPWSWDPRSSAATTAAGRDGRRSELRQSATHTPDFLADLSDWCSGTTGIPLVDAGMRELWQTGHMHNRVRMVVASLLTKNLGIHWRHGEEWFWDTLVDADPASNAFNWQWAAGCGDDAAPYFRIFNPETQAKRFDPDNSYISRWIPEYGTDDYPAPIVDLRESRAMALAAYESIK